MASYTTYANLREEIGAEYYNVQTTLNDNWTKLDAIFNPSTQPGTTPATPKALLRGGAMTPSWTGATTGADLNLQPTWNTSGTMRGIYVDVTHTAAGASSRVIDIRRSTKPIFQVDITSHAAVNGFSLVGAATGQPAELDAIGDDADISINLVPKGAGTTKSGGVNLVLTTDSRLSDARTPSAHAVSHSSGGTDALASGAVASAQLAANAVTQRSGVTSAAVQSAALAGAYADMTGMAVTMTTTGGDLAVWLTASVYNDTQFAACLLALSLDGAAEVAVIERLPATAGNGNDIGTAGTCYLFTGVAAGSHTVKGRYTANVGTTSTAYRNMVVIELKK